MGRNKGLIRGKRSLPLESSNIAAASLQNVAANLKKSLSYTGGRLTFNYHIRFNSRATIFSLMKIGAYLAGLFLYHYLIGLE